MAHSESTSKPLNATAVLGALRSLRARQPVSFAAFYSSQLGG